MKSSSRLIALCFGFSAFSGTGAYAQPTSIQESVRLLGQPLNVRQTTGIEQPCLNKIQNERGEWICAAASLDQVSAETETTVDLLGRTRNLLRLQFGAGPVPTPNPEPSPGDGGAETQPDLGEAPASSGKPFWASSLFQDTSMAEVEAHSGLTINRHDVYVGGTRIWMGRARWEDGSLRYTGGVPPTQLPVPLVVYPLGPLVLKVEAGVEFEGLVNLRLMPGLSWPLRDSTIIANLETRLYAAAYLQASAQLLLLKGGLEGRVNVVDANWGAHTFLYLNGFKPRTMTFGFAQFFGGKVVGFVDYRFFMSRWKRLYQHSLYEWSGKCVTFVGGISGC